MPLRQLDTQGFHAGMAKLNTEAAGGPLAAAIAVGVEADIDSARAGLAKLGKLPVIEVRSQRRHRIGKAALPQSRHIEQTFHQQDTRRARRLRPTIKSPFGPWQETVPADAISQGSAIQSPGMLDRKGERAKEGIAPAFIYQTAVQQALAAVTAPCQVTAQTGARRLANAHTFDDGAVVDAATSQIGVRLLGVCQLPLIETVGVLQ